MVDTISFVLPKSEYEDFTWILQDEHNPASHPPLIASGSPLVKPPDIENSDEIPETLTINGFYYLREVEDKDANQFVKSRFPHVSQPESVEDITRWRKDWLPEMDKLVALLENFDPNSVEKGNWKQILQDHDDEYRRVFRGIHANAVATAHLAANKYLDEYIKQENNSSREEGMMLLQGFSNCSLDRSIALWELSRLIRGDEDSIHEIIKGEFSSEFQNAQQFLDLYNEMLNKFGSTSNNGLQDLPTWRDGASIPIEIIRSYALQDDSKSPVVASLQQKNNRMDMESILREKAKNNSKYLNLINLMEIAQHFLPNLEDHNLLCDQQCVYSSRIKWLNIGKYLKRKSVLIDENDVFFYSRNELLEALENGISLNQQEVENRKDLQQQFRKISPPLLLGKSSSTFQDVNSIPSEGSVQKIIKGTPASAGVYTGIARVFESINDAQKLQNGQILVVRALSPPWTPYVAIAGGIVTNSGGPLSHGAIVAREFGVPAIVGTKNGTDFIRDGMSITINGTDGTIIIQ